MVGLLLLGYWQTRGNASIPKSMVVHHSNQSQRRFRLTPISLECQASSRSSAFIWTKGRVSLQGKGGVGWRSTNQVQVGSILPIIALSMVRKAVPFKNKTFTFNHPRPQTSIKNLTMILLSPGFDGIQKYRRIASSFSRLRSPLGQRKPYQARRETSQFLLL